MARGKRERQRERRALGVVEESAATLTEVRGDLVDLGEAVRADGTIPIKVISPGWGSAGYYSAEVLEQASTDRVWPRGTQMYLDHPSATERTDRPERSLRDLAAVTETDATWRDDPVHGPGLYAQAKVFSQFREVIGEMAPHIGVSIRAAAERGSGEAEGRRGPIVERIVEGLSIDFVTKAGRGGEVLTILESAGRTEVDEARNVGEWFQSRIHLDFTTRADEMFGDGRLTKDERIALSNGIGSALDAFAATVEELAPQLLTRDLWVDPAATPTTESEEDTMTPEEIKEAVAAAVKAEVTPIQTELDETKAKLEQTEAELAEVRKAERTAADHLLINEARGRVEANAKVKALPAIARATVVEALVLEATATDGKLDTDALDEATTKAVERKVAELAEASGSPVTGAGSGDPLLDADKVDEALADVFQNLGLSEDSAKRAVAEIA